MALTKVTNDLQDVLAAAQPTITSVGTLTGFTSTGIDDNATSNAITITSDENVGIGVTPEASYPDRPVVRVGSGLGLQCRATGNPSHTWINSNVYQDASTADDKYIGTDEASQIKQANGAFSFNVAASGTAGSAISWTTAMTIDNSGNVGIGLAPTSFANRKSLDIGLGGKLWALTTATETGLGNNFYFDGAYKRLVTSSATRHIQDGNGHTFDVAVSGAADSAISWTTAMTVDNSGNLLVGRTSSLTDSKIQSGQGITVFYPTSNSYWQMYRSSDNTFRFTDGTVYPYISTGGAFTNSSDERLKENIVDSIHGLSSVLATQPRSFKFKHLEDSQVGFIAQELKEIIPEVVDGNENDDEMMGVNYGALVAVAFKAIQEQQAIIESLTARITALEGA